MIPNFKRVLASTNPEDHQLMLDIPGKIQTSNNKKNDDDFENWLNNKQMEELEFKNLSNINSTVKKLKMDHLLIIMIIIKNLKINYKKYLKLILN